MKSFFSGNSEIPRVYSEEVRKKLRDTADLDDKKIYTKEDILSDRLKDAEYMFSTWGAPVLTESEISEHLPMLKCVFYGAGTVQYFARPYFRRNVRIFSAWAANGVPVAEYTAAQILLANKGFFLACRRCQKDRHGAASYALGKMPGNFKTKVGIIGAGMIGKMVINRLKQDGIIPIVYDPFLSDEKAAELGVEKAELAEIFSACTVISNHVANLPSTVGMFDYTLFSLMKKNAVFINTGRGAQVVEDDLIRALKEEPERSAVLDVTYPEPPSQDSELLSLENVFLTPHIAGSSGGELERMGDYMLDQYEKYISGEPCEYEVTEKMLATMA